VPWQTTQIIALASFIWYTWDAIFARKDARGWPRRNDRHKISNESSPYRSYRCSFVIGFRPQGSDVMAETLAKAGRSVTIIEGKTIGWPQVSGWRKSGPT
jgi:hypothetical protein